MKMEEYHFIVKTIHDADGYMIRIEKVSGVGRSCKEVSNRLCKSLNLESIDLQYLGSTEIIKESFLDSKHIGTNPRPYIFQVPVFTNDYIPKIGENNYKKTVRAQLYKKAV